MSTPLASFVTRRLTAAADPAKAGPMAAYLKTDMPFYGVQKPARTRIVREALQRYGPADADAWEAQVLALWALPHREEKYCALDWLLRYPRFLEPVRLPLLEQLIREGAWWDLVDPVATSALGHIVGRDRWMMRPVLQRWITDDDLWIRRSALICQIKHKEDTDEALLFELCASQAADTTFWIRKAIGWALREYAKTSPDAVRVFLARMGAQLSGLTLREATKHLTT
jgi:3-methyladenine DNA glycosylase AlkD